MDELQLADEVDRQRPRLRAVAYRILGSLSEADDAVQEAWLRLRRTDARLPARGVGEPGKPRRPDDKGRPSGMC